MFSTNDDTAIILTFADVKKILKEWPERYLCILQTYLEAKLCNNASRCNATAGASTIERILADKAITVDTALRTRSSQHMQITLIMIIAEPGVSPRKVVLL